MSRDGVHETMKPRNHETYSHVDVPELEWAKPWNHETTKPWNMFVLLSSFSDKFFLFTFSCLPPGLHHEFSHHRNCSNGTVMLCCCSCMTQCDAVTLLRQRYAKLKMQLGCRIFFLQCIAMFDKSTGKLAHVSFIYEAQVKLRYYISMHSLQSQLTRWYKNKLASSKLR